MRKRMIIEWKKQKKNAYKKKKKREIDIEYIAG